MICELFAQKDLQERVTTDNNSSFLVELNLVLISRFLELLVNVARFCRINDELANRVFKQAA